MIDLRHVQTFVAIDQYGSFSAAAEKLDIAQPTVSLHIKLLEKELGYTLFDRVGKRAVINAAGSAFLSSAQNLLHIAQGASALHREKSALSGTMKVCIVQSVCTYLMPTILRLFHEQYPQVHLKITVNRPNVYMLEQLRNGEFDASIVLETPFDIPSLASHPLWSSHLVIVAHPSHHLAQDTQIRLGALANEPFVFPEDGAHYRRLFVRRLSEVGLTPRVVMEIDNLSAIKQAVMEGIGLGVFPAYAVESEIATGRLVCLPLFGPAMSLTARLIWHKNRPLAPTSQAFVDLMCQQNYA